ncbi:MAG: response regulator [Leptospiraceae bacterium]|nr:response regulator [Leptospiraceae bacterium]
MSKKIIIIDDESHIRMLLEQSLEDLEDEGVAISTASNGKDGLELILKEKPDLVFCDVMMPHLNGYEVCTAVKQEHKLSAVYFILLTARGQEADREKGLAAGADMYMTKPFDPEEVVTRASEILGIEV